MRQAIDSNEGGLENFSQGKRWQATVVVMTFSTLANFGQDSASNAAICGLKGAIAFDKEWTHMHMVQWGNIAWSCLMSKLSRLGPIMSCRVQEVWLEQGRARRKAGYLVSGMGTWRQGEYLITSMHSSFPTPIFSVSSLLQQGHARVQSMGKSHSLHAQYGLRLQACIIKAFASITSRPWRTSRPDVPSWTLKRMPSLDVSFAVLVLFEMVKLHRHWP